jgi:hypothetical protein
MIWPLRLWHALTKVLPFRSRSRVLHWQTWDPVHVTRLSCLISFLLSHQEHPFICHSKNIHPLPKWRQASPPGPYTQSQIMCYLDHISLPQTLRPGSHSSPNHYDTELTSAEDDGAGGREGG